MLHYDMTLSRLMVYAQSIEESKLESRGKGFKRERTNGKKQPRFKKRTPNQDIPNSHKVNHERVVVLKMLSLLALLVERNTLVNV